MAGIEDLREVYESFCSFGSSRNLATGSNNDLSGPQLDNAKFAKLCKDCKIVDNKKVTVTDVDILFNKAKGKGARKLDWDSFLNVFQMLAETKYPAKNPTDAYNSLLAHIVDKGPIARGTIASTKGVYDKLTDSTQYTGTHKNRFDENGVGKGASGRDQLSNTRSLSTLVDRSQSKSTANVSASKGAGATLTAAKKRGQTQVVTASAENLEVVSRSKKADVNTSTQKLNKSNGNLNKSNGNINKSSKNFSASSSDLKSGGSVFDRLTNTSTYTGSHKHRFNADGTGRGISGRDAPAKGGAPGTYRGGDVKDLSQILRS